MLPDAELRLAEPLGAGTSAEVFALGGEPNVVAKLAREAAPDALAREWGYMERVSSVALPRVVGAAWFVAGKQSEATTKAARPALLLERIEAGPALDTADPVAIAEALFQVLRAFDGAGLAHGDLKPDNLRIDSQNVLRVLDLGLAHDRLDSRPRGGTPRYLGLGDDDLGTARERDLLAAGLLLAELARPELRSSDELLRDARGIDFGATLEALLRPLIAPRPGLRHLPPQRQRLTPESARAQVTRAYARLRSGLFEEPVEVAFASAYRGTHDLARVSLQLATLRGAAKNPSPLAPLDANERARWIVLCCGPAAANWPHERFALMDEHTLGETLVTALVLGDPPSLRDMVHPNSPPADVALSSLGLALALGERPVATSVLWAIETREDVAAELLREAGRTRLTRGELLQACSALDRATERGDLQAIGLLAEAQRRANATTAAVTAQRAIGTTGEAQALGRAVLARLAYDAGDLERAEQVMADALGPACCEVRALIAGARGEPELAAAEIAAGLSLASRDEQRSRLLATRGFVSSKTHPERSYADFRAALRYAIESGATLEEATYLTSSAALAVDLGYFEEATDLAERASWIWDAVGRPEKAARAYLSKAAALAAAGSCLEALSAARAASRAASLSGDAHAEGYAALAELDALEAGASAAQAALAVARRTLTSDDDRLRTEARAVLHGFAPNVPAVELDTLATTATGGAAFEWWGARAACGPRMSERVPTDQLLASVIGHLRAPLAMSDKLGGLMRVFAFAAAEGRTESARRLMGELRLALALAEERSGPRLGSLLRARYPMSQDVALQGPLDPGQLTRLEELVRAMAGASSLRQLLGRILDALIGWTGVERGMILLVTSGGSLSIRAARNLAQRDLGHEQLEFSHSLAKKALLTAQPVVAVDAIVDLPDMHRSVHALRLRSVLAVPLIARGEVLGVVYLDDRVQKGAFGSRELTWVRTLAALAAAMINGAREEARSGRMVREARAQARELRDQLGAQADHNERLARELDAKTQRPPAFAAIVGESLAIRGAIDLARRVARSVLPVLIAGESGTGKELFARAIHETSEVADAPFVGENCSAIPEALLESALFGHQRGAFTGADKARRGLFEIADGGTLFLDEIGEMGTAMQAKLLRVLQDGVIRPLGSETTRHVRVRLLCATHRDLAALVALGRFREDLYYRIATVTVVVPPLRDRREDIALLARHFLQKHADRPVELSHAAVAALERLRFPGNVRQLENQIRRALVLADAAILPEHFQKEADRASPQSDDLGLDVHAHIDALYERLIGEALEQTSNNQSQAAKLLGLSRFGLLKIQKRLGMKD